MTVSRTDALSMPSLSRTTLVPLTPANACVLVRLYTDPRVRTFLGGVVSEVQAHKRLAALVANANASPAWAIRVDDAVSSVIVGLLCLHADGGDDVGISCLLLPEYQGQGYATQAVRAGLTQAFDVLGCRRVVAAAPPADLRSLRLVARVGMRLEGGPARPHDSAHLYACARPVLPA